MPYTPQIKPVRKAPAIYTRIMPIGVVTSIRIPNNGADSKFSFTDPAQGEQFDQHRGLNNINHCRSKIGVTVNKGLHHTVTSAVNEGENSPNPMPIIKKERDRKGRYRSAADRKSSALLGKMALSLADTEDVVILTSCSETSPRTVSFFRFFSHSA